ncbi:MAG: wax ester/triacylglycerol synthase family O-acyltransferase [Candidatus Dormibacteraeota bacterium]|nr:wax ester/triacylglycerol synthase family O-acyltransferase [Candidatus Dormibacteraeota bacterium]
MRSGFRRLSPFDRGFLRLEEPGLPEHVAGLCLLEAGPLLDPAGDLDLESIRGRLERRLQRVPELRRVIRSAPPLGGPPFWADDPHFSIARHVHSVPVHPPGDEAGLLATTELLVRPLIDRSHPLWELWFVTGVQGGRVGLVFKIHHAIADGLAAVALVSSLLDFEATAPDPPAQAWRPEPEPTASELLADHTRDRLHAAGSALGHPVNLARGAGFAVAGSIRMFGRSWSAAPRTSLNRLPGSGRRLGVAHLDLEVARTVAHAHDAKVNDVVLCVVAGGIRELLLGRGEPVDGLQLKASVPATLRSAEAARELGNAAGALMVTIPVGEANAYRRLEAIAASSRTAKAEQRPAHVEGLFGWLSSSGLARPFIRRQRMINFFVSDVPGPPVPLYLLGARIEEVMPIVGLAGNMTLVFAALSYCGGLDLVMNADAGACPDVGVLIAGLVRAWEELTGQAPIASCSAGAAAGVRRA